MHPDWLGSPQHVVAGALLGCAVVVAGRALDLRVRVLLAIGVTMLAEVAIEIVEYPILYGDDADATAYYDTVADLASTLVGAIVGASVIPLIERHRRID